MKHLLIPLVLMVAQVSQAAESACENSPTFETFFLGFSILCQVAYDADNLQSHRTGSYTFQESEDDIHFRADGTYQDGHPSGRWQAYFDGIRFIDATFPSKDQPGQWQTYSRAGHVIESGTFLENGIPHGELRKFTKDGVPTCILKFDRGKLVDLFCNQDPEVGN